MRCPNCGSASIGRVGTEQYYCWDCCVEFNVAGSGVRIFQLDAEGELIAAEPENAPGPAEPAPGAGPA